MMILLRVSILFSASLFTLMACTKNEPVETPKVDTKTEIVEQTSVGMSLDNSPTIKLMGDVWKFGTIFIASATNPAMTDEQFECLMAGTRYFEIGREEAFKLIGEDYIKASDEFYSTAVGQKSLKSMEQKKLLEHGREIKDELVVITDEDQAKITEFMQTEAGKKLTDAIVNNNGEEIARRRMEFANEEKARCNIG